MWKSRLNPTDRTESAVWEGEDYCPASRPWVD